MFTIILSLLDIVILWRLNSILLTSVIFVCLLIGFSRQFTWLDSLSGGSSNLSYILLFLPRMHIFLPDYLVKSSARGLGRIYIQIFRFLVSSSLFSSCSDQTSFLTCSIFPTFLRVISYVEGDVFIFIHHIDSFLLDDLRSRPAGFQ